MRQEHKIDTKKIQRKVYLTYFQDGLWDVVLGLFLLGWGFTVWFDLPWLPGAIFMSFFFLALGLKQKITYPRIGFSKLAEQRKQMIRLIIAGAVALVLGLSVLGIFAADGMFQWLRNHFEFIFGSMIAIAIALIAYWWRIYRWYLYAGMVFLFFVFNQWSDLSFSLSFIMPGGIFTLCGLNILYRFLRKYPRVSVEDFNGNQ